METENAKIIIITIIAKNTVSDRRQQFALNCQNSKFFLLRGQIIEKRLSDFWSSLVYGPFIDISTTIPYADEIMGKAR